MKKKRKLTGNIEIETNGNKWINQEVYIPELSSQNTFFKSTIFKFAIIILILGLTIFPRLFHIDADPPYVSWSQDLLTDPSQYTSFARSKVLWGEWDLFNQYGFLLWKNSALTFFSFLSFNLFGVGRFQANLTAVVLNILSLLFLFLALRKGTNNRTAILAIFLLATDFTFLAYNRETFAEVSAIFFFSLGFYFLVLSSKRQFCLWLAGASHVCAILFGKMLAIFILPACLAVLILLSIKEPKRKILPTLYFLGGLFLILLPWFFLTYIPASKNISGYLTEMSVGLYGSPEAFKSISHFFRFFFSFGQVSKVFFDMPALSLETDLFYRMPAVFIMAFLFLLYWFLRFFKRKKILDSFKLFSIPEVYSVFWFVFGLLALMPWNYRPLRYQVLLIPSLAIMAGLGLDQFLSPTLNSKEEKLSSSFWMFFIPICMLLASMFLFFHTISFIIKLTEHYGSFETLLLVSFFLSLLSGLIFLLIKKYFAIKIPIRFRAVIVWALISFSLVINFLSIFPWLKNPKFSLLRSSKDLGLILNKDAVISGPYAPALSTNNRIKLVLHMFGVSKADPLLFERYPITHLALERNGNRQWAFHDYPNVMNKAKIVATYYIEDMPVDIYRVAGVTGNAQAKKYQLSAFERALLIMNSKLDSAKTVLENFNQQNPNNISAHLNLTKIYIGQKDYRRASQMALKAIQLDETNFALHYLLGWAYFQMANQEKSNTYWDLGIKQWERALQLSPRDMKLKEALEKVKKHEEVIMILNI